MASLSLWLVLLLLFGLFGSQETKRYLHLTKLFTKLVFFFLEHWADLLNELSKEDLIRAMEGLHQTVAAVDRVTDFTNRQ
jgi:hypothetical protein